jgi:hypothetical protein
MRSNSPLHKTEAGDVGSERSFVAVLSPCSRDQRLVGSP